MKEKGSVRALWAFDQCEKLQGTDMMTPAQASMTAGPHGLGRAGSAA